MSKPRIMLGGVEIAPLTGAAAETFEPAGGSSLHRMSDGSLIKQTLWSKMQGTISAEGWLPPGLDGLDFSLPLELRSTKWQAIGGTALVYTLTSTPRPDFAPLGQAWVGRQWVRTGCAVVDGVATLQPAAGATRYRVTWLPVFSVFCERPSESQNGQNDTHSWSLTWQEV